MRNVLPQRRRSETSKFRFGKQNNAYHLTTSYYLDDTLGEVFISGHKSGTDMEAIARDIAVLMSLNLQHGCSMATMRDALTREGDNTASTIAGVVADLLAPRCSNEDEAPDLFSR